MKKITVILSMVLLCMLCGCSMGNEKKTEGDVPKEYQFLQTNVGKSAEEVKAAVGTDWTDQSYEDTEVKQWVDADGNDYIFYNDRLAAVRYVYSDKEQGFEKCRELYEYFEQTYGEERKDNVLPEQKTLKDITTLEEFQSFGNGEDTYDAASNWYFAKDSSQWECASEDERIKQVWNDSGEKPVLILNLWMREDKLSVVVGYTGFPK